MGTPTSARFQLAWQPTVEDWAEGFTAYRRSPRGRRTKLYGVVLAFVFFLVAVWLRFPELLAAPLILLFVVFGTSSQRFAKRAMRRFPALNEPTSAVVTSKELIITTGGEKVTREWSSLGALVETEGTFVLFMAPERARAFTLLAKRGLADDSQLPALRALLQERIPATAKS
jgi:YcxB-like protein